MGVATPAARLYKNTAVQDVVPEKGNLIEQLG